MFVVPDLLVVRRPSCVFAAPQSLVFAIATSLVTTLARGARTIAGVEAGSVLPPLIAAMIVGASIVAVAVVEPACRPKSTGDWLTTIGVAAVNSLMLFVAALGIEKF